MVQQPAHRWPFLQGQFRYVRSVQELRHRGRKIDIILSTRSVATFDTATERHRRIRRQPMGHWTGKLVCFRRAISTEPIAKHIPPVCVSEHFEHVPVLQPGPLNERAKQHLSDVPRTHIQRLDQSRQYIGGPAAWQSQQLPVRIWRLCTNEFGDFCF